MFYCIGYRYIVLNLMLPFEIYHGVICFISVDIFMENRI